jgi:probable phosphoglycerate mutase
MTTTRVHPVRHGATVLSAEDRFAGSTDVARSDERRRGPRLSPWWDRAQGS